MPRLRPPKAGPPLSLNADARSARFLGFAGGVRQILLELSGVKSEIWHRSNSNALCMFLLLSCSLSRYNSQAHIVCEKPTNFVLQEVGACFPKDRLPTPVPTV